MADELAQVEMVVESVRVHMLSNRHVVILKETGRDRYLPIWIGPWEASAIAMRLQGLTPERPLTHDLFVAVLEQLGARVDRVVIATLADETYHARLVLVEADARYEVDARPSDAIAIAVRLGAPIYAASEVLELAALGAEAAEDEGAEGEDAEHRAARLAAIEATGERIDPTRLDIFREFVNSLDIEGDQREGPPGKGG